jgi:hypothetical protein
LSKLLKKTQIIYFIDSILTYGINLELTTKAQELKTLIDMHRFINNKSNLKSYIEETRITIETPYYEPLVIVEIDNSVLSIIPVSDDDIYESLSVILEFIYSKYRKKLKKKKVVSPNDFEWV